VSIGCAITVMTIVSTDDVCLNIGRHSNRLMPMPVHWIRVQFGLGYPHLGQAAQRAGPVDFLMFIVFFSIHTFTRSVLA
jgi:hypothetical protein